MMNRFARSASVGNRDTTCVSNCGQSPPEITATLVTPSSLQRAAAIGSPIACLLSARVPSRSNAISCFMVSVPCGAAANGVDRRAVIRLTEDGGPGDDHIRPGFYRAGDRIGVQAAVGFDMRRQPA